MVTRSARRFPGCRPRLASSRLPFTLPLSVLLLFLAAQLPAPAQSGWRDFTFKPITSLNTPLLGWIQAGPGTDLLWDKTSLYRMREPGVPELLVSLMIEEPRFSSSPIDDDAEPSQPVELSFIYPNPSPTGKALRASFSASPLTDVVFDGRWAWAPLRSRLLAIDLSTGEVEILGEAEGLPPGRIKVAPLGPGRVCAVGGATGRAWCAVIQRAIPGRFKVDVFHEARLAQGAPADPALAFVPRFAATLRDSAGRPFVLVGRKRDDTAGYYPLLLDPDRRQVQVIPQRISSRLDAAVLEAQPGALYWIANTRFLKGSQLSSLAGPEKHGFRLERFTLAARRPETVLGQLPPEPPDYTAGTSQPGAAAFPRVAFVEGAGYVLAEACWLWDPRGERLISLRGAVPPARGERRVGHSRHYGTVLMIQPPTGQESTGEPVNYAFRPRAGLATELAADAGGREVLDQRNSLEGRLALLRRYPKGADDAWTTLTAPIVAGYLLVERDAINDGALLALSGEDQRDSELRREFGPKVRLFDRYDSDRLPRANRAARGDDPLLLPLRATPPFTSEGTPPRSMPPMALAMPPMGMASQGGGPRILTFTDALGQPLAGAEVRPVQAYIPIGPGGYYDPQWKGTPRSIKLPPLRTDAGGQVTYDAPPFGSGNGGQFEVSHPDYGRTELTLYMSELSVTLPRITGRTVTGEGMPVDNLGRQAVPLVRRGSPEARRAFRGRVLDPQGRPVAGARVSALGPLNGLILFYWENKVVTSDAEGRFCLYPPTPDLFKPYLPKIDEDSTVTLLAWPPDRPEIPTWIGALDNRTEHDITLGQPPRPHRFVFLDSQGHQLDPAAIHPVVTFYGEGRRPGMPGPQVVFDGHAANANPASATLRHGIYRVQADGDQYFNPVRLTANSPEEIVFKLRPESRAPTRAQIEAARRRDPRFKISPPYTQMPKGQAPPMMPPGMPGMGLPPGGIPMRKRPQ